MRKIIAFESLSLDGVMLACVVEALVEALVVVLTRNCPDSHVVYLDGGPDGASDVPAPCYHAPTRRRGMTQSFRPAKVRRPARSAASIPASTLLSTSTHQARTMRTLSGRPDPALHK